MAVPHILVIDDDITSLDIVAFLFEERGYQVERCTDGRVAISYVQTADPDLLIVDLMMPEINGKDTIIEIRKLGLSMPIIAFTAVDDPDVHAEVIAAGANAVLTKPCRPEKLVKQIEKFLQN